MTVKLGNSLSEPRLVNAGAPQGSVLGTYVFNIATDDLEDEAEEHEGEEEFDLEPGDLEFLETIPEQTRAVSTPTRSADLSLNLSPIQQTQTQDFVLLSTARNVPAELSGRIEPTWRPRPLSVRKFVDDNLQIEKLNMKKQTTYRREQNLLKNPRVIRSENMFKHIAACAYKKVLESTLRKQTS